MLKIRPTAAAGAGLAVAVLGAFSGSAAAARPARQRGQRHRAASPASTPRRQRGGLARRGHPPLRASRPTRRVTRSSCDRRAGRPGPSAARIPAAPARPIAERWNGSTLTPSALPPGLTGFISDASAPSAHDVWAASQYGGYVLHWNGGDGASPGAGAAGRSPAWRPSAQGRLGLRHHRRRARGTGTWHFDGTSWRQVHGPASAVYRASAVSRRDIWAIAATGRGDYVLRFNGRPGGGCAPDSVFNGVQPARHPGRVQPRTCGSSGNRGRLRRHPCLVLCHWDGASLVQAGSGLSRAGWQSRQPARTATCCSPRRPASAAATGLIIQASAHGWGATIAVRSATAAESATWRARPGARLAVGERQASCTASAATPRSGAGPLAPGPTGDSQTTTAKDRERGQTWPGLCSCAAAASSCGKIIGVEPRLDPAQVLDARLGLHLARRQQRAAVLVGQLGDGQRGDPARLRHDLGLVQADQRPQDRQRAPRRRAQ